MSESTVPQTSQRGQADAFAPFGLAPSLLRGIAAMGFTEPTPIQTKALPSALAGHDILACAMTGSGKTAAFVLPMLQRLAGQGGQGHTRALVLTPTRELAAQVHEHLVLMGKFARVTSVTVFGGVSPFPQERALKRGVDIVVATPGRLLDHMRQGVAKFDGLEVLVLDEADRMLDMGFLPDVQRILETLPKQRQTMLFSATLPKEIVELSRRFLHEPVRIDVERPSAPATGVTQEIMPVPERLKPALLLELLKRKELETALVFTRTKHRANRLADHLAAAGVRCDRIHGNRSQGQRDAALGAFKAGKLQVLVATDIAARGIDVQALPHVVNFDVPNQPEDYIHRVGRTARAQTTGHAITFAAPDEGKELAAIERAVGKRIARRTLQGFDYNAQSQGRLEIPLAERIAAIRARKAEERARARAKTEAKTIRDAAARHGAPRPASATERTAGGPTHPTASQPRHAWPGARPGEHRTPHAAPHSSGNGNGNGNGAARGNGGARAAGAGSSGAGTNPWPGRRRDGNRPAGPGPRRRTR